MTQKILDELERVLDEMLPELAYLQGKNEHEPLLRDSIARQRHANLLQAYNRVDRLAQKFYKIMHPTEKCDL